MSEKSSDSGSFAGIAPADGTLASSAFSRDISTKLLFFKVDTAGKILREIEPAHVQTGAGSTSSQIYVDTAEDIAGDERDVKYLGRHCLALHRDGKAAVRYVGTCARLGSADEAAVVRARTYATRYNGLVCYLATKNVAKDESYLFKFLTGRGVTFDNSSTGGGGASKTGGRLEGTGYIYALIGAPEEQKS